MANERADLAQVVLTVVVLGGLLAASIWVLRPVLPAAIWATMIVVATWPLLTALERRLGGRRRLAASLLTLALLLLFVLPFTAAVATLVANRDRLLGWAAAVGDLALPPPPDWLVRVPAVGAPIAQEWREALAAGPSGLAARLAPFADDAVRWLLQQIGGVGLVAVEFLLTVLFCAYFYVHGEKAAGRLLRIGRRLGGERGEDVIRLAGLAVRGVALAVVLTALAQALLGGLGLLVAGLPFVAVLTAVMFLLALAQIGAVPVLLAAAGWMFWHGSTGWGVALLVWSLVVGSLDNFLRPVLIRRGVDLPLLLVFTGVIGGLIAFGLVGIFIGPVLLAVGHTLLDAWASEDGRSGSAPAVPAPSAPAPPHGVGGPAA
jgi:predicted PurR-regulated permease PerM